MELVQIRTVEVLRAIMQVVEDIYCKGETITDEDLIWFVCMQEAESLLDSCRTKDIASLFRNGVTPISNLYHVQEHLDTRFEDGEEYHEEQNRYLTAAVYRHFGCHDQANELMEEDESEEE